MGLFVMKPDFQSMSVKELRAYVLEHREDDEAFYALVDRNRVAQYHATDSETGFLSQSSATTEAIARNPVS